MTGRHTASQAGRTPAGRLTVQSQTGQVCPVFFCPVCPVRLWRTRLSTVACVKQTIDSDRPADCTGPVHAQLVRRTAPANTATLGNVDSVCGGTA
eukprot:gene23308-biopygen4313